MAKRRIQSLLLTQFAAFIFILVIYRYSNMMKITELKFIINETAITDHSKTTLMKFDRFIFATYKDCCGIGNQMYRIASLYGIGLHLNRTPGFDFNSKCQRKSIKEYLATFPNVVEVVKFHNLSKSEVSSSDFGHHVTKFDDPEIIHDVPQKYLILSGNYFQSYKYFHKVRDHIRKLFDFHPEMKRNIDAYGEKLFIDDKDSHKMCIHIRRGDFIKFFLLETRADFLIPAMDTVRKFISKKNPERNISLIFFSNDWKFMNSLNYPKSEYSGIYCSQLNTRTEDLYFGTRFCDSFILSSSGSTFGFWMAYLMPEGKPIFYNGQIEKNRGKRLFSFDFIDYDRYPKDWNILEFDKEKNTVTIDNRWYFEKFKLKGEIRFNGAYL